jgi:hypothetical protein
MAHVGFGPEATFGLVETWHLRPIAVPHLDMKKVGYAPNLIVCQIVKRLEPSLL